MNTQAIDTAKSLQRVKNYLERFEQGKGYCKECIHSFIDKNGDEIPLLVADLKVLLDEVESTLRALSATQPAAQGMEQAIEWPKARDVGRFGDMSPDAFIRVGLDADNDVYVSICDGNSVSDIEFCTPGGGGGRSSRTRMALIALMFAIEADNASHPSFDFWKRSIAAQAKHGEAQQ